MYKKTIIPVVLCSSMAVLSVAIQPALAESAMSGSKSSSTTQTPSASSSSTTSPSTGMSSSSGTTTSSGMGQSGSTTMSSSMSGQSGMGDISYEAKNLMGVDVTNQQGEKLGKIRNLAIGNDGRVSYAVLGTGGLAGMNETELAIPWSQLQISSAGAGAGEEEAPKVTLNVSKDQLTSEFAAFEDVREGKSTTSPGASSTTGTTPSGAGAASGRSTSPSTTETERDLGD